MNYESQECIETKTEKKYTIVFHILAVAVVAYKEPIGVVALWRELVAELLVLHARSTDHVAHLALPRVSQAR